MKQLFLAVLAAVGFTTMYAQPHSILVYGNVGYESANGNTSTTGNTTTNFSVNPGVGYQFNEHLTIGVQGGYTYADNPGVTSPLFLNYNYANTTKDWYAGAFFRYTKHFGKIFSVYGQVNASYISQDDQYPNYYLTTGGIYTGSNYSVNSNGIMTQIFPAVAVNVYRGFALNFAFGGIQYTSLNTDGINGSGSTNSNDFKVTLGQQINVGISKNFSCHSHMHHKMRHHGNAEPGMELRKMDMPTEDDEDAPKPKHRKHHKKDSDDDDDDAPKRKKHHDDDDDK